LSMGVRYATCQGVQFVCFEKVVTILGTLAIPQTCQVFIQSNLDTEIASIYCSQIFEIEPQIEHGITEYQSIFPSVRSLMEITKHEPLCKIRIRRE
jgi:hypothetical protein